jgi:hypothetical protein
MCDLKDMYFYMENNSTLKVLVKHTNKEFLFLNLYIQYLKNIKSCYISLILTLSVISFSVW